MSNEKVYLGRFVKVSRRRDGTDHVVMEVPKPNRPDGWPATIVLPERRLRVGRLSNPLFMQRVLQDAARLNDRLDARRARDARLARPGFRGMAELGEIYFRTIRFKELSLGRQKRGHRAVQKLVDWALERGNPPFASFVKADVEDFLAMYDGFPSAQTEFRWMWNTLALEAQENKWRDDNPCVKVKWPQLDPKRVNVWGQDTVDLYAAAADQIGQPGLGALIRFNYLAGQRLGDALRAKHGEHFNGERFTIRQSKRKRPVTFVVPKQLGSMLERARYEGSPYMFNDFKTGTRFTEYGLTTLLDEIRAMVCRHDDKMYYLRALRHSAVCRFVAANVPLLKITAVTGHKPENAQRIIDRYAVDIKRFADSAVMDMHRAEGGSDDDFSDTLPIANHDWLAKEASQDRYVSYFSDEHYAKRQKAAERRYERTRSSPRLEATAA